MTSLARPLTQEQLDAATRLHSQLTQWASIDSALATLALAFPQWNQDASLLKVAAINQLYGTNLYAVVRMAMHVSEVMQTADPTTEGIKLVERLANLPKAKGQQRQPRHYSFASKLAYFFIDSGQFFIYDSYVVKMLMYHLGKRNYLRDDTQPYVAFIANLKQLQERSGLVWQGRELDRYLWLAGEYHAWLRDPHAPINREVSALFQPPATSDVARYLAAMIGEG